MRSLVWRPSMFAQKDYQIFKKYAFYWNIKAYKNKKKKFFLPLSRRIFKSLPLDKFLAEPAENFYNTGYY